MNITMEERALKFAVLFLTVLTIVTCAALPYLPTLRLKEQEMREERLAEQEFAESQIEMQDLEIREETQTEAKKGQLSIRLPDGVDGSSVNVSYDYVTQTIQAWRTLTAIRCPAAAVISIRFPMRDRGRKA